MTVIEDTPTPVPLVEQSGTVTQRIHRKLLLAGCDMQAMQEAVLLVQELEEAHIKTLGDLAGVRGGRDLVLNLLRDSEKRNRELEDRFMEMMTPRPRVALPHRVVLQ